MLALVVLLTAVATARPAQGSMLTVVLVDLLSPLYLQVESVLVPVVLRTTLLVPMLATKRDLL